MEYQKYKAFLLLFVAAQLEFDFPSNTQELPIKIIGFSKGGIVLNQLVFEIPLTTKNETLKQIP